MDESAANVDSRREHERFPLRVDVDVKFVHQSKEYPKAVGETWQAQTVDFSRGGVCLATPWPLARGDVLELRLVAKGVGGESRVIDKRAVVVNVRGDERDEWTAGLRFVSHEDEDASAPS